MDRERPCIKAANEVYRLPPPLWDARCRACWLVAGILLLVLCSFYSLDLQWISLFSTESATRMGRFLAEFFPPNLSEIFLIQVGMATLETLAMSLLGTLLAVAVGLVLALPGERCCFICCPSCTNTPVC